MTKSGLKGQHISARGKIRQLAESVALGFDIRIEIDREPARIEKQRLLRSK